MSIKQGFYTRFQLFQMNRLHSNHLVTPTVITVLSLVVFMRFGDERTNSHIILEAVLSMSLGVFVFSWSNCRLVCYIEMLFF